METEWLRENFQHNNIFDNTAAASELGFRYTIDWQTGVRRIVDWLDARGRINDADEPVFYQRLLDAWQSLGKELAGRVSG